MFEKTYDKLTFRDNFIFTKVMSDPANLKPLLVKLFPDLSIENLDIVMKEHDIHEFPDSRGIRFDVYARDKDKTFSVEMQLRKDLCPPERSRYYSAMSDAEELGKGIPFTQLKDQYIIFICPFDPFDANLFLYTFTNRCHETGQELKDRTMKIYMNCAGDNIDDYP